jgi:predicted RNase H-like HicB family nuclease
LPYSYLGYSIKEFVEPSAIASPQAILSPILAAGLPSMNVLLAPEEGALVEPAWVVFPQVCGAWTQAESTTEAKIPLKNVLVTGVETRGVGGKQSCPVLISPNLLTAGITHVFL